MRSGIPIEVLSSGRATYWVRFRQFHYDAQASSPQPSGLTAASPYLCGEVTTSFMVEGTKDLKDDEDGESK